MATRKVTVVNPAGYQEQLPNTDNLLISATPIDALHAPNKKYVDDTTTALGNVLDQKINDNTTNINNLQGDLNDEIADREAGDSNLQDQIDAIIAQGEIQNLDDVLNQGNTSTLGATFGGDVTAARFIGDGSQLTNLPLPPAPTLQSVTDAGSTTTNGIVAATLEGDIDCGEY